MSAPRATGLFACFAFAYFMSYGLRSVSAVIAPGLVAEFGLTNAQLGSLSAAYFLSFAAMQLPLGIWLDRFGARRTNATLLLVAAAGCACFAMAGGVAGLWTGRALIGVGVAGCLMSALKGYRFWFAPARQQTLAAWMLVAGTLGALTVTVPVQHLLPVIGWRGVFWLAAGLVAVASLALWFGVPTDEERSLNVHSGAGGESVWRGYATVFASAYFWRFSIVMLVFQASFVSMQSLWAGPWFMQVLGLTPEQAAQALFVFNAVLLAGYLALGWVLPRLESRFGMVRVCGAAAAMIIGLQLAIGALRQPWAWALWLGVGLASSLFTSVQPHVAMAFPKALTGRAYTAMNLLVFAGIFANQWVFGVLVDVFRQRGATSADAFGSTMFCWQAVQVLALLVLLFWRTPLPVHGAPEGPRT